MLRNADPAPSSDYLSPARICLHVLTTMSMSILPTFTTRTTQLGQPVHCSNLINDKLLKYKSLAPTTTTPSAAKYPCVKYCEDVITRCVGRSNLDELSDKWRLYIVLLNDLAVKLSTTYNIETIISPLDVQISEVIMNIQENGANITEHVSRACRAEMTAPVPIASAALAQRSSQQLPATSSTEAGESGAELGPGAQLVVRGDVRYITGPLKRRDRRAAPATSLGDRHNRSRQASDYHASMADQSGRSAPAHDNNGRPGMKNRARTGTAAVSSTSMAAASPAAAPYSLSHLPSDGLMGPMAAAANSYLPNDLTSNGPKPPLVIEEIRNYLQTTKLFFSALPNAVCTNNITLGSNASSAIRAKPPNCFQEQLTLADVNTDFKYRFDINRQAGRLDDMRSMIERALRGEEIDWTLTNTPLTNGNQQTPAQQQPQQPYRLGPAHNGLPNSPMMSPTTTTTPTPDLPDDTDDSDLTDESNPEEDGSGDGLPDHGDDSDSTDSDLNGFTSTPFDLDEDDTGSDNPGTDSTDTGDDCNNNDNIDSSGSNNNDQTLLTTGFPSGKITNQNSVEDDSLVTLAPNDLVTVEAGMHKSSGQNSKLVISYSQILLFVMCTCVVLLIAVGVFRLGRPKLTSLFRFDKGVENKTPNTNDVKTHIRT